jgi:hypothetical protein
MSFLLVGVREARPPTKWTVKVRGTNGQVGDLPLESSLAHGKAGQRLDLIMAAATRFAILVIPLQEA